MIRNNAQLKYAMKRKVSNFCSETAYLSPGPSHEFLWTCHQSCEDDETFKLLQLSKEEQTEVHGDQEDGELVVAEYESDNESKVRSR